MSDALLEVAVANWAARFTANGVDASDYARVTGSITSWSQWCSTWSDRAQVHYELGRAALGQARYRSAGEALARSATYFHFAQFLFDQFPDERRVAHERAVAALSEAAALLDPPGQRVLVPFEGEQLVGLLRLAPGTGPRPLVILVSGLDSTKEELRSVEAVFLERGLSTFAFDGPGQGECEHLGIRPDWENVIASVIAALSQEEGVDAQHIGLWGVSLGGYYAARAASADLALRACVSLSGPYDFSDAFDGLNPLTKGAFTARSHSADQTQARSRAAELSIAGRAETISVPLLVIAGTADRLISFRDAQRLASEAPHGELVLLEGAGHGCANLIQHHRPLAADWLAERLGVTQTPPTGKTT